MERAGSEREKQILVLLASARQNSDTRRLVQAVFGEVAHREIDLLEADIHPYRYGKDYPPEDAFLEIMEKVLEAKVLVLATPVYWYAMSGVLKNFLDRWTDLITVRKELGRQLKGKAIFLVAVGSDDFLPDGFEVPFKLTAKYFEMTFGGSLYAPTAGTESAAFPLGDHREFLRELMEVFIEPS